MALPQEWFEEHDGHAEAMRRLIQMQQKRCQLVGARRHAKKRVSILTRFVSTVLIFLAFWTVESKAQQISEFVRACNLYRPIANEFLNQCRKSARPFKRDFFPSGTGAPVPEQHAVLFHASDPKSRFGLGCVIGERGQARFLGLYFSFKPRNFALSNSEEITFVDFQGNVGFRSSDGSDFTLLAAHNFDRSRQAPGFPETCQVGDYDQQLNQTTYRTGNWFQFYRVTYGPPTRILRCINRTVEIEEKQCYAREYISFINDTESAILFTSSVSILITEDARLFVSTELLQRLCVENKRASAESSSFVKELCDTYRLRN